MVGYNPWGPKELDTIECARTHLTEETRMIYIYYFKSYHMLFIRMIVKIVSISLKEEKENLTSPIELYIGYDFLMMRFGKQKNSHSQNFAHSSDYQGYFIYNDPSPVQDWL